MVTYCIYDKVLAAVTLISIVELYDSITFHYVSILALQNDECR